MSDKAQGQSEKSDVDVFWCWALERWRQPALAGQLLHLQEAHDAVILELLLLAWLAERGVKLSDIEYRALRAVGEPWLGAVVKPLRAQRQAWRDDDAYKAHRSSIKRLELAAERELAELYMATLGATAIGTPSDALCADALAHNLSLAQPSLSPELDVVLAAHLAQLLAAN